ncbi:MAG: FAD-dependent oxidoreductase [Tetrasphaera sp.]
MTRLVVVGNGMVGSRFTSELLTLDTRDRFEIDQFGAEDCRPYNRVLLSEVVSGARDVASIGLPQSDHPRLRVHQGVQVVAIDRADRAVVRSDGARTRYDLLVLATGAAARVPLLAGLDPNDPLPHGVAALRTIGDARAIAAATLNARSAVVLGAGVLGLEVACGLVRREVRTTIVHPKATLMERHLDVTAAQVVQTALQTLGVDQRTEVAATGIHLQHGRLAAVQLSSGEQLPCDLLVLTVGTVAATTLADACGLPVERGVVVDATLASPADRRVYAIGDCAQPPDGMSGLVAQGWNQARALAARLAGVSDPVPPKGDDIVRLKAPGLDVVTMGVCGTARGHDPGRRSIRVNDPHIGRHVEIVIADDRLAGATCVGAGRLAADLLATYTARTPVPRDPLTLLLDRSAFGVPEPGADERVVCRCNGVTLGDLKDCLANGAADVAAIAAATRAGTGCGGCRDELCALALSPEPLAATSESVLTRAKHG